MVQLISLMSIHRFDPDIFGDNDWHKLKGMLSKRECCLKLDVSVDVNWLHSIQFHLIPLLNKVKHVKQLTISAAHML
jgi:hypothetical protein